MPKLKAYFTELGYIDVHTYLNSGNVAFSVDENNENTLSNSIKDMIQKWFGLDIPVFVILQEQLEDLLSKAPDWWGTSNKDIYDNLIFVMSPATAEIIAEKIGEPTKELEQICICDNTIFWSFDRNKYCGFGKSRKIIFYREQKLDQKPIEVGVNDKAAYNI